MKLLLTGASGFIGKNFLELAPKDMEIISIYNTSKGIKRFVKEKNLNNVKLYRCDLTNAEEVKKLSKSTGKQFDYCIYLAGNVNVPLSKENPVQDLEKTTIGLINFVQCYKINRFIYMSSAAVYDNNKGIVTTKTKLNPVVPYCISKLAAEQYIKFFTRIGKINEYLILRFGGAFGLYSEKKFMTKLVRDIYINNKEEIEIYGDGTNIINVMYVKDAIKALLTFLKREIFLKKISGVHKDKLYEQSKKSNLIANLGQENMTLTEIVKKVAKVFNKDVKIKYTPWLKEQKYIHFKIKVDFNDLFGFKPDYSFERGIKEFGELLKNEG